METLYELETFKVRLAVAEPTLTECCSAADAVSILRPIYTDLDCDQEHFTVLLLNNKNRIRGFKFLSTGTQTASLVHPSIVFRSAVLFGACGIIVCHNHPAGNPEPSAEDIDITKRIVECGDIFGIRVLDHVIIGKDTYFSFSDKGMLSGSGTRGIEEKEGIRTYLWRRDIKRRAIASALNCSYGYLCKTLRGYRKVDTELDAIANHLKITRDHLNLLIAGKAPRTEPL